jgi:hypothetical protein
MNLGQEPAVVVGIIVLGLCIVAAFVTQQPIAVVLGVLQLLGQLVTRSQVTPS